VVDNAQDGCHVFQVPKTLNGPQGNVGGKTIDSVRLVEWGLNRLNEVTKQFSHHETNLLSFMTLDVEHFHSTTHVKSDVMSMLQYCCSFGNCVKENGKRLSAWSAFYFREGVQISASGHADADQSGPEFFSDSVSISTY